MDKNDQVSRFIFPYLRVYKDGRIERLAGTGIAPAGLDPETDVLSKDIIIIPETGVSARLYLPNSIKTHEKIPLVVYYHGGGFFLSSPADPFYHHSLTKIVAESRITLVSIGYRLAPEAPLPAAYEDSWAALQWVASHSNSEEEGMNGGRGKDLWLKNHADFDKVFLAGDSCGANMAHHFCLRLGKKELEVGKEVKIKGIAMIHPYFWGKDPVGVEVGDEVRKSMVDNWWLFVCPSDKGLDDPLINPFVDERVTSELKGLGCERVVVIVAEKDILRDRGRLYYEKLEKSGWKGKAEIVETEGEDHLFHIFDPKCHKAKTLFITLASFFNDKP